MLKLIMFRADQNRRLLPGNAKLPCSDEKKLVLFVIIFVFIFLILACATYTYLRIYETLFYAVPSLNEFGSTNSLSQDPRIASFYDTYRFKANFSEVPADLHKTSNNKKLKLVCYYNFPSGQATLQISDIDPNLCTHLNLAFASIQNCSIYLDANHLEYVNQALNLKVFNRNLKVILSIGGAYNENGFPEMVLNHRNRKRFIKSVISFAKIYKIDGLDFDWEFPGEEPNFDKKQRMHMTQLLSELRKEISKHKKLTLLLTMAVSASVEIIDVAYDVSYLNDYLDFVNVMTYDFHYYTSVTPFTGYNAPLYASSMDKLYLATLNINYSVYYWNSLGMDKSKIVVGLPTYGHSFRLTNINNAGLYAPASGFGNLGLQGFVSYPQTCTFMQSNQITPIFDREAFSPYAAKFHEWISFENHQSLIYKAEYIKKNNFGGAMVYSLNADDYMGVCSFKTSIAKKFSLTETIKSALYTT